MARHKVEICGVNTANIKVLSNEEMVELFKRYQSGDKLAKDDLINGNEKNVKGVIANINGNDTKISAEDSFPIFTLL